MKQFKYVCAAVLLVLVTTVPFDAGAASGPQQNAWLNPLPESVCKALEGDWTNAAGTILSILKVSGEDGSGLFIGSFRPPGAALQDGNLLTGCANTTQKLNAKAPDHVIVVSFFVRGGKKGDVTTWNGYYRSVNGKPTIVAKWVLCRPDATSDAEHFVSGEDRFVPVK